MITPVGATGTGANTFIHAGACGSSCVTMASIFNFIHINKRRPLWLVRCFSWSETLTSMYPRTVMAVTSSQTSQQHKYFIKLPSVYHSKPHLPRSLLSFPGLIITPSLSPLTVSYPLLLSSSFFSHLHSYHFPIIFPSSPLLSFLLLASLLLISPSIYFHSTRV